MKSSAHLKLSFLRVTGSFFLFSALFGCAQRPADIPAPVTIIGKVEAAVTREEDYLMETSHEWLFRTYLDIRITSPKELAGLCYRFEIQSPPSQEFFDAKYAEWKGKTVEITLSRYEAEQLIRYISSTDIKLSHTQRRGESELALCLKPEHGSPDSATQLYLDSAGPHSPRSAPAPSPRAHHPAAPPRGLTR